jgi:hypothetical protein
MRNRLVILAIVIWIITLIALLFVVFCTPAHAGTSLQEISRRTTLIRLQWDIDAKRIYNAILEGHIAEQKAEAKRKAEEVLSAEDIKEMKEKADRVFEEARRFIQALKDNQDGAMLVCSSQVIE